MGLLHPQPDLEGFLKIAVRLLKIPVAGPGVTAGHLLVGHGQILTQLYAGTLHASESLLVPGDRRLYLPAVKITSRESLRRETGYNAVLSQPQKTGIINNFSQTNRLVEHFHLPEEGRKIAHRYIIDMS